MHPLRSLLPLVALVSLSLSLFAAEPLVIDPAPRAVKSHLVRTWEFQQDNEGWTAESQCSLTARDGRLHIESTGEDPYFHLPVDLPGGQIVVELRMRSQEHTRGSVFWTTNLEPQRGEDKRADFEMPPNGEWLVTRTRFTAPGRLTDLRIDPGTKPGLIEIDSIRVIREELHPLTVSRITQEPGKVHFEVTNHTATPQRFQSAGKSHSIAGGTSHVISKNVTGREPLVSVSLTLQCPDWQPVTRTAWVVRPAAKTQWLNRPLGSATLSVARDCSMIKVSKHGRLIATLGPLLTVNGQAAELIMTADGDSISYRGRGLIMSLVPRQNEIAVNIVSNRPCEGPVVRVAGRLKQGLFAGLEYLGEGEYSSSKLDIETDEHIRFEPDPLKVTMPLMAFVTDRGSVAITWNNMDLQPVYASPNFFDGAEDHRMTLKGKRISATIRVTDDPLEESIAWCVSKRGLPDLPPAPRTKEQQDAICLAALNGPLQTDQGWGHCVQPKWARKPFADAASTVWRLSGDVPEYDQYVFGGAHVPNGTIYFVTGRAEQWLATARRQVQQAIRGQQPDGSYRYAGEFARGHFEDTASGICAFPAARLLEFAYVTGDQQALLAGLRTLDYMKRFDTPRGAQVWEVPLHTPDQLASAYLVWAYTRGFQLTGKAEYLRQARKWALSGLPFTYQWSRYPIMSYATPPVLGATNWIAPNWMGLPVQWVGGVYAYALTLLAPHEDTVDWNQVARGILISAQQQQYPDGSYQGLLPDSFNLAHQRRQPADINPCALVSLQLALDGEVDFLSVARQGDTVVAAPFPVSIRNGTAHIQGRRGVSYQVLINGKRIVPVVSKGSDTVPLDE